MRAMRIRYLVGATLVLGALTAPVRAQDTTQKKPGGLNKVAHDVSKTISGGPLRAGALVVTLIPGDFEETESVEHAATASRALHTRTPSGHDGLFALPSRGSDGGASPLPAPHAARHRRRDRHRDVH